MLGEHEALGADESGVFARQADGFAAILIDQCNDFLVDGTTEHHFNDAHRFGIGDAHALDELAFFTDLGQHLFDLRATTMHDNGVQTNQLEQHDIISKRLLEALFSHGVAAVLHDDGLAMEAL